MRGANAKIDTHVAYAVGHIEAWLEIYARSIQSSGSEFTSRVATILLAQAGGEGMGPEGYLPTLRRQTSKKRKAVEPMEMARRPRRRTQKSRRPMSAAARKRISQARKKWWASLAPSRRKQVVDKAARARASVEIAA